MLTLIIQTIDKGFTILIFIPMVYILYCRFTSLHKKKRQALTIYRICLILIALFLLRYFCNKFIFTAVNYQRFTDSGLFPLIKTIFYPEHS